MNQTQQTIEDIIRYKFNLPYQVYDLGRMGNVMMEAKREIRNNLITRSWRSIYKKYEVNS